MRTRTNNVSRRMNTRPIGYGAVFTLSIAWSALGSVVTAAAQTDPLPSWNDTGAKKAIIAFVDKVTQKGSADFIPVAERIAVFDNDGTLWPENPVPFEAAFIHYDIARQLPDHPEWKDDPTVQAVKKGDFAALLGDHAKGLQRVFALTHSGLTIDEFAQRVNHWRAGDQHPRYKRAYTECVYQPMLEVLAYFRAHDFQTWIVSGGGRDFMSVWSEEVYGIPPERVIGSRGGLKFELKNGVPTLTKTQDAIFIDDKEGKPVAIQQLIGRRPVAALGNSDGDQAMLQYTTLGNPRPSFGLIVHHTDAAREYFYDAKPASSGKLVTALVEAKQRQWTVVDMKRDWKRVLPDSKK